MNSQIKLAVLQNADLVGMTTTGAAINQDLIRALQPRIILVEEAAEILEAQLLACLSPALEHLILIGDHKQLRPSNEYHALAIHHHIDVSLFERLINNGSQHVTLLFQRRMHPAIASLTKCIPRTLNFLQRYTFTVVKLWMIQHQGPFL